MDTPKAARGAVLRRLRIESGLSLAELAERSGVPKASLQGQERGQLPNVASALRVARALGQDAAAIWGEHAFGGASRETAPVIALDFDGVLNDRAWWRSVAAGTPIVRWSLDVARQLIDPARVARVQEIADATGASVVVVSGWRRYASVDVLRALLRDHGLRAAVRGSVGGVHFSGDSRGAALVDWLAEHAPGAPWVVIDDSRHYYDGGPRQEALFAERLVCPADGLEPEHVAQAIEILKRGAP